MVVRVFVNGIAKYIDSPATMDSICGQLGEDPASVRLYREVSRDLLAFVRGVVTLHEGDNLVITPRYTSGG